MRPGASLLNFRRFYGPEQRNILMLWRNRPEIVFAEGDGRTPRGMMREKIALYCQHYGKSLSVAHWEETCDYYIRHFPFETYGKKWTARKGQAIHTESDFNRPLYEWGESALRQRRPDVSADGEAFRAMAKASKPRGRARRTKRLTGGGFRLRSRRCAARMRPGRPAPA